jgi:predicted 3-demethylubiquinone-9 3-methyltransferase (glyoxalase superfamily)
VEVQGTAAGQRIVPNLWFDTQAQEAAEFYTSVFPRSRVVSTTKYPQGASQPAGSVLTVEFELDGQRFVALNGGPRFTFDEAVSFQVTCRDQEEIDDYWARLSDGGEEGPCGWLKDRFGLSWQVVPAGLDRLLGGDDPQRAHRVMQAILAMGKIDIAALHAAADAVAQA